MAKRLPAARKPRSSSVTTPSAPPREAAIGDNIRAKEEAERVQLISYVSRITEADRKIAEAKAPYDAAKAERAAIVKLAGLAGFTKAELSARMEEMGSSTREMAVKSEREAKHRRWLGIITEDQARLQLGEETPIEAKDEAHWKAEGYKAGLRQMLGKPPTECPERFVQAWLGEHGRGLKEVLEANAPKPMPTVGQQAADDFREDNPDVDLDAEAKKLKKNGFMDTSAKPDDGFEASADELAGQKPRQAVKDAKEGATSGEPVADVV